MERSTFPFPLAVHSEHSHYHRFLLGADAAILAPFPKPYCKGTLSASIHGLGNELTLASWRKLYHASLPWVPGLGAEHYQVRHSAPYHGLPKSYSRPLRQFAAYDFVQIADPSVSALALVAGDKRVLEGFIRLADRFCERIEPAVQEQALGAARPRKTGRMLAGQFFEPNNRWLQPLLHVHSRVLNFTSAAGSPQRLGCIDPAALGRAAKQARGDWVAGQADLLCGLGYHARYADPRERTLAVAGVSERLLASIDAPRVAVLRLLERMVSGDRESSAERFRAELPPEAIAAMADQLEALLARSLSYSKPSKVGIPSEGPWRAAVREHLLDTCRADLALLDSTARRANSVLSGAAVFPSPPRDASHCHAPSIEPFRAPHQMPTDPELGAYVQTARAGNASEWILREFDATLSLVRERIVRGDPKDSLLSLRSFLPEIDQLSACASPEQLAQTARFMEAEFGRAPVRGHGQDVAGRPRRDGERALVPLDELFEETSLACEREMGGRCL